MPTFVCDKGRCLKAAHDLFIQVQPGEIDEAADELAPIFSCIVRGIETLDLQTIRSVKTTFKSLVDNLPVDVNQMALSIAFLTAFALVADPVLEKAEIRVRLIAAVSGVRL